MGSPDLQTRNRVLNRLSLAVSLVRVTAFPGPFVEEQGTGVQSRDVS